MHNRVLSVLVLLLTLGSASVAQAQTRLVNGRVFNPATQEGVPGAIISVVGGTQVAQADVEGRFRMVLPETEVRLVARSIGYRRSEAVLASGQTTVEIALTRDVLKLEDVVVTGEATTAERQNIATASAVVGSADLNRTSAKSAEEALQGKVVGARINMNSGAPGGGGQIQIRGVTTILGNGEPLFVVDGVIISNAQIQSGANTITNAGGRAAIATTQDNGTNRLADINPNDIESVEVLKSAAATAIYGSRATNGVVLIKTKRGTRGEPRFSITQRVGTFDPIRLVGTRRFKTKDDAFGAALVYNDSATSRRLVDSLYAINPNPFFDHQEQIYGNSGLSYETNATVSGGNETTRYFASATTKKDDGTLLNTAAKRDALRLNIVQKVGSRLNLDVSANLSRAVADRGLSNNDNTFTSPLYNFAYTPSIIDLNRRNADGTFPENPFPGGGGTSASNPFETLTFITNREDVWRQIGSANITYGAFNNSQHDVDVTVNAGADRFDQENNIYSPNFLQYEGNDGFKGRSVQGNTTSRSLGASLNLIWTLTPSTLPFTARTSAGAQAAEQDLNIVRTRARGLIPGLQLVNQGTVDAFQNRSRVRNQALYAQEELLAFDERLSLTAGVRAERSSVNGDREKFFVFPRAAASYRFVDPITYVDGVKLRASYGQSGNQPRFGDRDITLASGGVIDGRNTLVASTTLGNPDIKPETLNELEYGIDAQLLDERVGIEYSFFDRKITNLLLTAPLAPSSGLVQQIINGGQLDNKGHEFALTANPIRNLYGIDWVSRVSYYTIDQVVKDLPVPRFVVPSSGFGTAFGRSRIAEGVSTTAIWGNAPIGIDGAVVDTIIGEATPDFEMQFGNDFNWKAFSVNMLIDWRKGGDVSSMTQTLFDEGRTSRDYDDPSPDESIGATLGEYRYNVWGGGGDARIYVQDGSFVKLREVTLSYQLPSTLVNRLWSRARDARVSLSGRNLAIWSDYWGSDPEVNNFGNQNVGRFVDLAPYPPTRSYFFSIDVGF